VRSNLQHGDKRLLPFAADTEHPLALGRLSHRTLLAMTRKGVSKDKFVTDPDYNTLPTEIAQALLDIISLGSLPVAIRLATGSYSNFTHIITACDSGSKELCIVVKRYQAFGHYDRGQKARREFAALQCAFENGIPAPQPLYLDETGTVLGIPGIVTRYVSGAQNESPDDPVAWARALAETLVRIHTIPSDLAPRSLLLDANDEAAWFIHSDNTPEFMQAHPDGESVWKAVRRGFPRLEPVPPSLVHLDYWPGNILWEEGKVSAVVDWEEAAFGDPAIDVAYCRMDMLIRGLPQVADEFLAAYETAAGVSLPNLGFWELAAAARPMFLPQGWVDQSPQQENFSQFITQAEKRWNG
jgi:Ser/Thr protein kinase RdoA (MazF antagonist)